ncbi:hypothetical protein LXA43DRAFT_1065295 [Ganoderma leucocontextum]|nr:hypothetical protein LXA43DRAFT_1065295 [Ganoderma leucocontextum]
MHRVIPTSHQTTVTADDEAGAGAISDPAPNCALDLPAEAAETSVVAAPFREGPLATLMTDVQYNALGLIFDTPAQTNEDTHQLPGPLATAVDPLSNGEQNLGRVGSADCTGTLKDNQGPSGNEENRGRPRKRTRADSGADTTTETRAPTETTTAAPDPHALQPSYNPGPEDSRVRFTFSNPPGTPTPAINRPGTPHPRRPSSRRAMISPTQANNLSLPRGMRIYPFRPLEFGSISATTLGDFLPRAQTPPLEYYPPSPPPMPHGSEGNPFPRAHLAGLPPAAQAIGGCPQNGRAATPQAGPSRSNGASRNTPGGRPLTPPGAQMYDRVSELPQNAWHRLMDAIENNVIHGWPGMLRNVEAPPFTNWPEGRAFLHHNSIYKNVVAAPNNTVDAPVAGGDYAMNVDPANALPRAQQAPLAQHGVPAQPAPPPPPHHAPLPPLPIDIQNFTITHRALPHGGRLTNVPYPLPRPHLHGAAMLQPPIDIVHTQEPDGGFYRVRRDHPEGPLAAVDDEKVRYWMGQDKKTTMIGHIYLGDVVREGESWNATQAVRDLLEQLTGRKDFTIIHAELPNDHPPFDPGNIHTRNPNALLIGDLEAQWVTTLCAIQTLSTRKVTVLFFPAELRLDDFLGRIVGFAHNVNDSITKIITDKVNSEAVRAIIVKYVQKNPFRNHEPLDIATQRIVDSLRVRVEHLPPNGQLAAFVYMDSPVETTDGWERWTKEMMAIRWDSVENGTGLMRPVGPCRGCSSAEHTAHHCPLPDTPGWFGPIPPEKAHPERGLMSRGGENRGRGGRGRGRGGRGTRSFFG